MGPCGEGFEALVVCESHGGGWDALVRRKMMLGYCSVMLGRVLVSLEVEGQIYYCVCMLSFWPRGVGNGKRRVGESCLSTRECRKVLTTYDTTKEHS